MSRRRSNRIACASVSHLDNILFHRDLESLDWRGRPAMPSEDGCPAGAFDYLGSKGKQPGTLEAPDEKSAIAEAMNTFNITPARRFKIMVTKIEAKRE